MARTKKPVEVTSDDFYKGYDIKWLRTEESHPDYYLVAEYDALQNGSESSSTDEEGEE